MYFTYNLLSQTLDTNLNFILHLYTIYMPTIAVFIVLIQLLLLNEINHCLDRSGENY